MLARGLVSVASCALVIATAVALFLFATRAYLPASATLGASASSVFDWSRRSLPASFGTVTQGLDLAHQAGITATELVLFAALNTAFLLVLATAVAVAAGVLFGFWVALHAPRRSVVLLKGMITIGASFPAFFGAFLLQVLAVELAGRVGRTVVPVYGFGLDAHLVIPTLALALAPFAYVARLVAVNAAALDAREFARTARAKGLSERTVVYQHIAPNMLGAIGEAALGALRLVLGGIVIVEYLVTWPGLGVLAVRAASVQDAAVFVGAVAVLGAVFLATDVALDVLTRRRGLVIG